MEMVAVCADNHAQYLKAQCGQRIEQYIEK
jgi:hypothetical protein